MTTPFAMSRHALERAVDMAVTPEEIREAFERPREKFFAVRSQSWMLTRGRVTLCIKEGPQPIVTTVMWARTSDWVADRQYGALPGRENEDDSGMRRVVKARRRR